MRQVIRNRFFFVGNMPVETAMFIVAFESIVLQLDWLMSHVHLVINLIVVKRLLFISFMHEVAEVAYNFFW